MGSAMGPSRVRRCPMLGSTRVCQPLIICTRARDWFFRRGKLGRGGSEPGAAISWSHPFGDVAQFQSLRNLMMRTFDSLTEREVLALAISLEEEDARVYSDFAE